MTTDHESPPGAWARELAMRGTQGPKILHQFTCLGCGWTGDAPSFTDDSQVVDGAMDRTHRPVCPSCFQLIQQET